MDLILYGADHREKAQLLNRYVKGLLGDISVNAMAYSISTLIFIAHGNGGILDSKSPQIVVDIIKKWKALNPELKTVEIITCNARHGFNKKWYKKRDIAEYGIAKAVKTLLKGKDTKDITLKSLPKGKNNNVGGKNGESILLHDKVNQTWCYVITDSKALAKGQSGSTDGLMQSVSWQIKQGANKQHGANQYNLQQAAQTWKNSPDRANDNFYYSVESGHYNNLRDLLVVV